MPSALDIVRVTVEAIELGQKVLNVYHYLVGGTCTDAEARADLMEQLNGLYSSVGTLQVNDTVYQNYYFHNVTDDDDMGQEPYEGDQPAGTGEPLPTQVAAMVVGDTLTPGRQGKKFFGGLAVSILSGGLWSGAAVTVLLTVGDIYVAPYIGTESGVTFSPVVGSPTAGWSTMQTAEVGNIPSTQRRRKIGVGV